MRKGWMAGACVALLAQGCAVLPGGGPAALDTYELTAPATAAAGPRRPRLQVLVTEPVALKAFDGENVVVRTSATSIEYLGGAQWADRLPRVVQARLAAALQATGRLGGVGRPGEGLAIDYQITSEIRAFEIRADGQGRRAHVELFVRLLNDRNGTVRAARLFDASVPVSGAGNDAFIAAIDRAFGLVAAEVTDWTLASL